MVPIGLAFKFSPEQTEEVRAAVAESAMTIGSGFAESFTRGVSETMGQTFAPQFAATLTAGMNAPEVIGAAATAGTNAAQAFSAAFTAGATGMGTGAEGFASAYFGPAGQNMSALGRGFADFGKPYDDTDEVIEAMLAGVVADPSNAGSGGGLEMMMNIRREEQEKIAERLATPGWGGVDTDADVQGALFAMGGSSGPMAGRMVKAGVAEDDAAWQSRLASYRANKGAAAAEAEMSGDPSTYGTMPFKGTDEDVAMRQDFSGMDDSMGGLLFAQEPALAENEFAGSTLADSRAQVPVEAGRGMGMMGRMMAIMVAYRAIKAGVDEHDLLNKLQSDELSVQTAPTEDKEEERLRTVAGDLQKSDTGFLPLVIDWFKGQSKSEPAHQADQINQMLDHRDKLEEVEKEQQEHLRTLKIRNLSEAELVGEIQEETAELQARKPIAKTHDEAMAMVSAEWISLAGRINQYALKEGLQSSGPNENLPSDVFSAMRGEESAIGASARADISYGQEIETKKERAATNRQHAAYDQNEAEVQRQQRERETSDAEASNRHYKLAAQDEQEAADIRLEIQKNLYRQQGDLYDADVAAFTTAEDKKIDELMKRGEVQAAAAERGYLQTGLTGLSQANQDRLQRSGASDAVMRLNAMPGGRYRSAADLLGIIGEITGHSSPEDVSHAQAKLFAFTHSGDMGGTEHGTALALSNLLGDKGHDIAGPWNPQRAQEWTHIGSDIRSLGLIDQLRKQGILKPGETSDAQIGKELAGLAESGQLAMMATEAVMKKIENTPTIAILHD